MATFWEKSCSLGLRYVLFEILSPVPSGWGGAPGAGSCAGVELGYRLASDCTSVLGLGVGASASGARCEPTRLFLSESKDWEGDVAVLKS